MRRLGQGTGAEAQDAGMTAPTRGGTVLAGHMILLTQGR